MKQLAFVMFSTDGWKVKLDEHEVDPRFVYTIAEARELAAAISKAADDAERLQASEPK